MSYYAVHKNCKPAQLPVKFAFLVTAPRPANRATVFQLISARMNTGPRLLEHRIQQYKRGLAIDSFQGEHGEVVLS